MKCPTCLQSTRVVRTVEIGDKVIRKRKCTACGKEWESVETIRRPGDHK